MNGKFQIIWYTRDDFGLESWELELLGEPKLRIHHFETDSEDAAHALTEMIARNGGQSGVLFTPTARLQVLKSTDDEFWSEPQPPEATKE